MEYKVNKLKLSPEAALEKLKSWCAYQERSQYEATRKLSAYGLSDDEAGAVVSALIEENFISEERFALAFAGGKFRIKRWGRNKIRTELRKHRISEYSLRKALAAIDETEYAKAINGLIEKKLRAMPQSDRRRKYYTTLNYAVSRGFESDLVTGRLNEILGEQDHEFRT